MATKKNKTSTDITNNLKERNEIFDLLRKIKNKQASEQDVLDLTKKIIKKHFSTDHQPDKIETFDSKANERGDAYFKKIIENGKVYNGLFISKEKTIDKVLETGNVLNIISNISHEIAHLRQHELSALVKNNPELLSKMTNDAKKIISDLHSSTQNINDSDMKKILQFLKPYVNDEVVDKLIELNLANFVRYSHYFQLKHEEDARRCELLSSKKILNELMQDPLCDGELYAYLEEQLNENNRLMMKEEQKKDYYYKDFYDRATNISVDSFENLVRDFEELKGSDDVYDAEFLKIVCNVICENKDFNWLHRSLGFALNVKSNIVIESICNKIKNDLSISAEDKEDYVNGYFGYLSNNKIKKTKYTFSTPLVSLLNKEQIKSVIKNLSDAKQFVFLEEFWKNLTENVFADNYATSEDNKLLSQAIKDNAEIKEFMAETIRPHMQELVLDEKYEIPRTKSDIDSLSNLTMRVPGLEDMFDKICCHSYFYHVSKEEENKTYKEKYGDAAFEEKLNEELNEQGTATNFGKKQTKDDITSI